MALVDPFVHVFAHLQPVPGAVGVDQAGDCLCSGLVSSDVVVHGVEGGLMTESDLGYFWRGLVAA